MEKRSSCKAVISSSYSCSLVPEKVPKEISKLWKVRKSSTRADHSFFLCFEQLTQNPFFYFELHTSDCR